MQPDPLDKRAARQLLVRLLLTAAAVLGGAYVLGSLINARDKSTATKEAQLIGAPDLRTDMTLAEFRPAFKGKTDLTTTRETNACVLDYAGAQITVYCNARNPVEESGTPARLYVSKWFPELSTEFGWEIRRGSSSKWC